MSDSSVVTNGRTIPGSLPAWGALVVAALTAVYSAGWQGSELRHHGTALIDQRAAIEVVRSEGRASIDGVRAEIRAGDRAVAELGIRLTRLETTLQSVNENIQEVLRRADRTDRRAGRSPGRQ